MMKPHEKEARKKSLCGAIYWLFSALILLALMFSVMPLGCMVSQRYILEAWPPPHPETISEWVLTVKNSVGATFFFLMVLLAILICMAAVGLDSAASEIKKLQKEEKIDGD
jgi:hypothetical protein